MICVSTDSQHPLPSRSLGDRAFSVAEIRSSNGVLRPDVEWYIRNQLLPTLSRLVEPLNDIPRSYLSDCLGLESTSTSHDGYEVDDVEFTASFKPRREVGVD